MRNFLSFVFVLSVLCSCSMKDKERVRYSERMVEEVALQTFLSNKKEQRLETAHWDYVPGLVAISVLKAWRQYPEHQEYYDVVKKYADYCLAGGDTVAVGVSNIDDLAAGKIFFTLYQYELAQNNLPDAERYKHCATFLRNKLKYNHKRIAQGMPGEGCFFHKAIYPNQMWLDGLYMGAAMYAEWQYLFGEEEGEEANTESWTDIASQFMTMHRNTYDKKKKLNYHAWSADPTDPNSFWARQDGEYKGCSPEFWGRGMGWYFAALVDVLELMPDTHTDYKKLLQITNEVAEGLALYQDHHTGSWYQLLQYGASMKGDLVGDSIADNVYNICDAPNYLESSASAMFTYAYLKGMRIGLLNPDVYKSVALKAYQGLLDNFIRYDGQEQIKIIQSCASAGLGPAKDKSRTGTTNYYLCGKDVGITQNEGKAIGPFIMASLEYEMVR